MKTIAIVNQKGGSGKTTTAINVASMLARRGWPTLLVDLDPQSHCAVGLGVPVLMQRCGRDPAYGSSVILTAATDSLGFFIFLGLAAWLLLP